MSQKIGRPSLQKLRDVRARLKRQLRKEEERQHLKREIDRLAMRVLELRDGR